MFNKPILTFYDYLLILSTITRKWLNLNQNEWTTVN